MISFSIANIRTPNTLNLRRDIDYSTQYGTSYANDEYKVDTDVCVNDRLDIYSYITNIKFYIVYIVISHTKDARSYRL